MSSYDGGGFEEWVRDSFHHAIPEARIVRVIELLRPWRSSIDEACDDYDEDTQSWRDYRNSLWSRIPENIQGEMAEILDGSSKWCAMPADVPMTPYSRTCQIASLYISGVSIHIPVSIGMTPKELGTAVEAHARANGLPV